MSSMVKKMFWVVSAVAVMSAAPAAMAGRTGPCAEDAKKLCPNMRGQALGDCMKKNQDKVSAECKAQKDRANKIRENCKGDAEKFCKDVKPGKGRLHGCLKKNEAQLSAACKDAMASAPAGKGPPKN